jgi:hypothetical protein
MREIPSMEDMLLSVCAADAAQTGTLSESQESIGKLMRGAGREKRRWDQQRMTTVCGFSEEKPVVCRWEIATGRCETGCASAARETTAGAGLVRFVAEAFFAAEDVVSAISTQGPQWDDETGLATAGAV